MENTDSTDPMSRRRFLRTVAGTAAVAGATGPAAAQQGTSSGGGGSTQSVTVGPGGQLVFEPESLTITPGTAVQFTWDSGGHNVVPDSGNWGHEPIEDAGFSFTPPPFQEMGSHPYVCVPHESAGMTGTIEVSQGGGSSGSSAPTIPSSAKALSVATISFMLSTLGLAYFFIRYGGDYRESE